MAQRKGSSAPTALSPSRKIAPSTAHAQRKMRREAKSAERTGRSASAPTSRRTGTASRTFMPAYSAPIPAPAGRGETSVPPRAKINTKATSTGTRMQLRRVIPRVPFRKNRRTAASPKRERRGENLGASASKPASMPAQGTKESSEMTVRIHFPPRPKSSPMVFVYPPCRFPSKRKREVSAKKRRKDNTRAGNTLFTRKKRTSSAPDRKPAPMHVPTMNSVVLMSPISLYL